MNVYFKIFIWVNVLLMLFFLGFSKWSDKELERQQDIQDSIITERHREQRMLDWKADSLFYEVNNSLDSLSVQIEIWKEKANKYDSIQRNKSRSN